MPSFLNKVFGYKKHDDKEAARPMREPSDSTLLDGKYEAISPILSPSASTFAEAKPTKEPDRDGGFSLFKSRARGASQKPAQKRSENVPRLTLHLPGPKENSDSRTLGVVFEADLDSQIVLDDADIAAKRLSPLEALILIRACTQAITVRGLETLGIMHPHWFSASPDIQRKIISLFIRSLTQSQITTLSPTATSSTSAFEKELHSTRSPHDVAAVLRWGLRHLSLENGHFGKDNAEWGWYSAFFQAERNASYPSKGFSELLLPQLPASHIELLTATLSLISSLASHAEANSISGSKLSKFLGLWLLMATRAEQFDDWDRFYARWERSGRILEHLFLAYLREESLGQRLPTRLLELVNNYPYNNGSLATDDDLLSRPRFSTRQYDALFVRVETLLAYNAQQPKQHPVQLLLEAFQLPIDDASSNEHITLWDTLKTTAFEEATSNGSEGPQFARIFVDETIHLLSIIPADNNLPTSPALLSPTITKFVPRKRSSSLTKAIERAACKSNANDGSTPVSPTSPVITDWAQFSLSGFGEAPATQPLPALLSQDDDVEVTQPRISPKSSRHRGKSRTRRRRSEDHELDTPLSSQPDPESSNIETKLASIHVVQIDEAFIDFWSDAVVDPISADWPTFVICGLKQIPCAKQSIRWLVIEQAYSHQEPSRVPSPDGRRGRSPRPSFRSDISGFRINSVFSSARKRFSVFSKSVTDLDPKKSGGKTPAAGELGEVLLEEEPTSVSTPPTKAGLHVDENTAVIATVTSGATVDVADQPKVAEMSTVPIAVVPPAPAPKEESDSVQMVAKVPSIEPAPPSGGGYNGSSMMLRPSVRASEETITAERDPPPVREVVNNPKVDDSINHVNNIASLAADTSGSRPPQGTCDPTVLTLWPASSAENPVAEVEQVQQSVAVNIEVRPVELVRQKADRDERLQAESTGEPSDVGVQVDVVSNGSREDAKAVVMPPTPETVVVAAVTPVAQLALVTAVDNAPFEPTVEESHEATQPLRKVPTDHVPAITVESSGPQEIDDLSAVSVNEVIATEAGAQLEPQSISSVADEHEAKEFAERVEIPTPTPELVAFVEETPGQDVSVDVSGRAGAPQVSVTKSDPSNDAAPQLVAFDGAASPSMAAELQATLKAEATRHVEAPYDEVILAVDTDVQAVNVKTEHTADQAPELAPEEAQPHIQDTIVQTAEAPLIEPEGNVSASHAEVAPAEVESQAAPESFADEDHIVGTQETETLMPVPERAALVDETCDPEIAVDAYEPVEAVPMTIPELEPDVKTRDPVVETIMEAAALPTVNIPLEAQPSSGAELPTPVHDLQAVEALSTEANSELATAASPTLDEAIAVKAEAQSTHDIPSDDADASAPAPESAPVEDTLGVAIEASEFAPSSVAEPGPVEDEAAEPIAKEAQVAARDAALIASEPVAHNVQASTEINPSSSKSTPQFTDEAANSPPPVVVSVTEEINTVKAKAQVEPEVVHHTVNTADEPLVEAAEVDPLAHERAEPELVEVSVPVPVVEDARAAVGAESSPVAEEVSEEVLASQLEVAAPTVEINETSQGQVNESQQVATPETDIMHESGGSS